VLRESLHITGTGFHLVHDSSDAPGYMSTLLIALTGQSVPRHLVIVRLRVVVEGVVFERDLEADVNLQYRFTWDRRNAYNQKVYGVVTAIGKFMTGASSLSGTGADPRKTLEQTRALNRDMAVFQKGLIFRCKMMQSDRFQPKVFGAFLTIFGDKLELGLCVT